MAHMNLEWRTRTVKGDEAPASSLQYGFVNGHHRFTATNHHAGKWGSWLLDFGPDRFHGGLPKVERVGTDGDSGNTPLCIDKAIARAEEIIEAERHEKCTMCDNVGDLVFWVEVRIRSASVEAVVWTFKKQTPRTGTTMMKHRT